MRELMRQLPFRLVIETAENGFLVYINQDFSSGTMRPKPYVFDSMEKLLVFVNEAFPKEKDALKKIKEIYSPIE